MQIKTAHKNCIVEDDRLNIGASSFQNSARAGWFGQGPLRAGPVPGGTKSGEGHNVTREAGRRRSAGESTTNGWRRQLRAWVHDFCGENLSKLDVLMYLARGHGINFSSACEGHGRWSLTVRPDPTEFMHKFGVLAVAKAKSRFQTFKGCAQLKFTTSSPPNSGTTLDERLKDKDAVIAALSAKIAAKDAVIAAKDTIIADKDTIIALIKKELAQEKCLTLKYLGSLSLRGAIENFEMTRSPLKVLNPRESRSNVWDDILSEQGHLRQFESCLAPSSLPASAKVTLIKDAFTAIYEKLSNTVQNQSNSVVTVESPLFTTVELCLIEKMLQTSFFSYEIVDASGNVRSKWP